MVARAMTPDTETDAEQQGGCQIQIRIPIFLAFPTALCPVLCSCGCMAVAVAVARCAVMLLRCCCSSIAVALLRCCSLILYPVPVSCALLCPVRCCALCPVRCALCPVLSPVLYRYSLFKETKCALYPLFTSI
jgi:hypothetical protein